MRLATFVHISDLHFGDIDLSSTNKNAVPPPIVAAMASNAGPIWDGLLGHSHLSLVRLEQLYTELKGNENAGLLLTGDLTAYGSQTQFDTAVDYLGNILRPPRASNPIGLREKNWNTYSVPGNHDHWSGKPVIFGGPTPALAQYFPALPAVRYSLSSGQYLTFLRVDSDSDVSAYGSNRFLARGCFSSQLAALSSSLPVPEKDEIRVLLVHHSYSASGRTLAMTPLSKAALEEFIVDHAVRAVLCGHIHQPPFTVVARATHLTQTRWFLEARSGTTTQLSTLPLQWRSVLGNRPKRPYRWPNSLLVHRLSQLSNGAINWRAQVYM